MHVTVDTAHTITHTLSKTHKVFAHTVRALTFVRSSIKSILTMGFNW